MGKAVKVISILLAIVLALNFGYAQAQQSYAQTLDEISGRLPYNWHGLDQLAKDISGQSLNGIWGNQDSYFQVGVYQFASEGEREDARGRYEGGQGAWDFASSLAGDVAGNASTYTSTIAGSLVFNLNSYSSQLQIVRLTISTGIYYDYGIMVWTADASAESPEIWGEVASLIGEKEEYEPEPTPPTEPGPTTEPPTEPWSEPEPEPTPTPVFDELVSKLDEAEQSTLAALLTNDNSFLNTAVEAKIQYGFLVGQLMERHDVDLELLKTILSSELYKKLDYAYDLTEIDSLRSYCRDNDYSGFYTAYREYATQKVRDEFSFDEAEQRIKKGFAELRDKVREGEFGEDVSALEAILDDYINRIEVERLLHSSSMAGSRKAAQSIDTGINVIDQLTSLCDELFGSGLDKAKLASELSLVWAQDEARFWIAASCLWGGTDKLDETTFEELRQKGNYMLGGELPFRAGLVFAAEVGLEQLFRGEAID